MARFGLVDSDDDEIPVQNVPKPVEKSKEHPLASQYKGKGRAVSPPMEVDELTATVPRPKKPTANALVVDESGQHRFAHELRPRKEQRVEMSEEDSEDGDSEEEEDEDFEDFGRSSQRAPVPWPARIGLEPHKVHVMQTSLFRMPEEQAAFDASKQRSATAGRLKPKQRAAELLSASAKLARKHSRGSEGGADGMRLDKSERASFDHTLDPEPYRPARKVMRVQSSESVSIGNEGAYADAGLAFGRSFRVSWGPGGQFTRIGGLSSSIVYIDQISMTSDNKSDTTEQPSSRLLDIQIKHTNIEVEEDSVPVAYPSSSLTFSTFASIFPDHDKSHEAQFWREGIALFDPLEQPKTHYFASEMKRNIVAIQRRKALADWIAATVAPTVAKSLLEVASGSSAQSSYLHLTGHQIEEAANAAAADGNIYLSMIISQSGGDGQFRADLDSQLIMWAKEGADKLIAEEYRKCLTILAGVAYDVNDVNAVEGLDWKRAFGLALWYGPGSDEVEGYDRPLQQFQKTMGLNGIPIPLPWYRESTSNKNPSISEEFDALFELLRLATAQIPLERAIYPKAFGPNSLDYRMTWHVYLLLSRSMRMKDFSDRQTEENEDDSQTEGHSETANIVTCAYAAQLESLGQIQKAVFVLLHLESSESRKRAIKELLSRQAYNLPDWQTLGLQSFSIPMTWIDEARAYLAQYEGRTFDAYEYFLKADQQRPAHDIAVNDLAPDAVIRADLSLLRALFQPFNSQMVDDWSFRGKLFLDYADAMERIPELVATLQENAEDSTVTSELDRLRNLIPQLVRALPDVFCDRSDPRHNAALSVMLSGLLLRFDSIKTKSTLQPDFDPDLVDEATRLQHIHNTSYNRFIQTVSALG